MVIGSWVFFIVGGLLVAGNEVEYGSLMEDGRLLMVLAGRWLTDAGWWVAGWVDAGRTAVDGAASWLSGVGRCS